MVAVAQLVRASDCGSEGRGFETHQSPTNPPVSPGDFLCPFVGQAYFPLVEFYGKPFVNMDLQATCLPFYRYFWFND